MMGRALTRPGRSPATSGSTQYRSVRPGWVAPAPLRAPRHREHVFVCAFPHTTSLGLLWKRANDTEKRPLASPFRVGLLSPQRGIKNTPNEGSLFPSCSLY